MQRHEKIQSTAITAPSSFDEVVDEESSHNIITDESPQEISPAPDNRPQDATVTTMMSTAPDDEERGQTALAPTAITAPSSSSDDETFEPTQDESYQEISPVPDAPGAYPIYPSGCNPNNDDDANNNNSNNNNNNSDSSDELQQQSTNAVEDITVEEGILHAQSQTLTESQNIVLEAYRVEQVEERVEEANIVPTIAGIEKKRFYQISIGFVMLVVTLGTVLCALIPRIDRDGNNNYSGKSKDADADVAPALTTEERAQRRQLLVHVLSPLNQDGVFDKDGPHSSPDRIAALEWMIDDIPVEEENTADAGNGSNGRLVSRHPDWKLTQRYIMALLYFSTNGDDWEDRMDFLTEEDECDWFHKSWVCYNDGTITSIDLRQNRLAGTLPDEISFLNRSLTDFVVGTNMISSTIPSSFGELSNLNSLMLQKNCLSGVIPDSFSKLTSLREMKLTENAQLTGSLNGFCNGVEYLDAEMLFYAECSLFPGRNETAPVECDCCECCDLNTFRCSNRDGSTFNIFTPEDYTRGGCRTLNAKQELWKDENCPCSIGEKKEWTCSTDCPHDEKKKGK